MPDKSTSLRKVTLHIPESNYPFFMELIKKLKFVKKIEDEYEEKAPSKQEVLESIKAGLEEVRLFKKGKLKLKTAKQLLDEL